MAITIKKMTLWTGEIGNTPGTMGGALSHFAAGGVGLEIVMAYVKPGDSSKSMLELAPVSGAKALRAASSAGLAKSSIPCLVIEGDDRPALGHDIGRELGAAGVNIQFLVAMVSGRKHRTIIGFEPTTDLAAAARAIRKAGAAARKAAPAARKGARRPAKKTGKR